VLGSGNVEGAMDWENKHFAQRTVIAAPIDAVREAARRFTGTTLADWSVEPTPGGFDASGSSAFHHAQAFARFTSVTTGTQVDIELLVRRSSGFGFMLFDIGGYYDGLLRKWLWALWREVCGVHADPQGRAPLVAPHGTSEPDATPGARVVVMDAYGNAYLGVVREVAPQGVLIAYDQGGERWVPAAAAHVVNRRDELDR
jgi:hypothetical protein